MYEFWGVLLALNFVGLFFVITFTLLYITNRERFGKKEGRLSFEPKISVIIPAYNEEKCIEQCIESVLRADYPKEKLEIIVIDDGSEDGTYEKAKKYEKEGVRVYRKKNSGKADTLNFGIKLAKGGIIAPLDADSYIMPYSIRRMLAHFDENTMAVASAVKVRGARNLLEEIQRIEYLFALFSRTLAKFFDGIQVTPGPFSMFRKEVFEKIGGFDTKSLVEDQEIALRMQKHNYRISCSIDTDVYTEIPGTFRALMKQRTRWQRGGFWNVVKYAHLINPKYGDFGVFVLPFSVFGYFVLLVWAALTTASFLDRGGGLYFHFLGFEQFFLELNALHLLTVFTLLIIGCWLYFSIRNIFREEVNPLMIAAYLLVYPVLITVFWFSAFYKEVKTRGGFSWN
jgi:cellulose synthase/poly-beta-1,6-N-acetylglucosamine synthase-like glycosyltransferase